MTFKSPYDHPLCTEARTLYNETYEVHGHMMNEKNHGRIIGGVYGSGERLKKAIQAVEVARKARWRIAEIGEALAVIEPLEQNHREILMGKMKGYDTNVESWLGYMEDFVNSLNESQKDIITGDVLSGRLENLQWPEELLDYVNLLMQNDESDTIRRLLKENVTRFMRNFAHNLHNALLFAPFMEHHGQAQKEFSALDAKEREQFARFISQTDVPHQLLFEVMIQEMRIFLDLTRPREIPKKKDLTGVNEKLVAGLVKVYLQIQPEIEERSSQSVEFYLTDSFVEAMARG